MVSVTTTISAISDETALSLFKAVALSENLGSDSLIAKLRLTRKQFYSIMKKLIDKGLIKRSSGKYRLTSFGKVVFSAQAKVEIAIKDHWKLKVIDSILMSADRIDLSAQEGQKIIDILIDNREIKDILLSNKK
jgi:predicted transcriptional regulator